MQARPIERFTGRVKITLSESKCLALLLLVQIVMMLIVQPGGDFPLNDDWAYSHSVEWLLSEGRIRLSDWIAPNLLPQTVLGASVTLFAGFSFETLRHLTQFIALLTSVAVYFWFRTGRLSPVESLIACLVLISMPSWSVLASSYMSDLYGMLFAVVGGDTAVAVVKEAVGQPDNQCNRSRVLGDAAASGPVGDTDRIYAGLVLGTSSVDALGSIFRAHAISRDDHD